MSAASRKPVCLVSACLAGLPCRYDGTACPVLELMRLVEVGLAVPVCPEELGGLSTPRAPAEIRRDRVINAAGEDVTAEFERGAEAALALARRHNISLAILKARSPSCGVGPVYDGTFSHTLTQGFGVTAATLRSKGIEVCSEKDDYLATLKRLLQPFPL